MVITHHGGECFKVTSGEKTLAFNPPSKKSSLKSPSFGADVVFVSLLHEDFNGVEQVARGDREPFVIKGPGEYEVAGVLVKGILAQSAYVAGNEHLSTIYLVELEGMRLCFLGPISSKKLTPEATEALEDIDILFVPIGGGGVLSPEEGHALAVELEPAIVIPMHFDGVGEKDVLKMFLKEGGAEGVSVTEKLTIKKKDLEGKEGEVVVLGS